MSKKLTTALLNRIIKRYGAVIDLKKNPQALIEISRELAPILADETPCGGTPMPPPSPGGGRKHILYSEDVMRQLVKVSRDLTTIKRMVNELAKRKH